MLSNFIFLNLEILFIVVNFYHLLSHFCHQQILILFRYQKQQFGGSYRKVQKVIPRQILKQHKMKQILLLLSCRNGQNLLLMRFVAALIEDLPVKKKTVTYIFSYFLVGIENGRNIARNNCLQVSKLPKLEVIKIKGKPGKV